MKTIIFLLIIFVSFTACRNFALTTFENPKCKTIISGFMSCNGRWDQKVPVLFMKLEDGIRIRFGAIIDRNADGFIFKPDRTQNYGPYPKPRLVKYDEIICMLDSNGQVIYGTFPNKYLSFWRMEWELVSSTKPKTSSIYLKFESNWNFSFCLEPGEYFVDNIIFKKSDVSNYSDFSEKLPEINIVVKPNKDNYIGDIYLDDINTNIHVYNIPCAIGQRPSDANIGIMFGAIGAIANEISKSSKDVFHSLRIIDNLHTGDTREKSIISISE